MSLTDEVYSKLKAQILEVKRAPGDLLYEAELASEFGVSKTPVREALRLLTQTGWVVVLPRKGYMVRPVELRDVRDIFAIRRMFEPSLARDAAAGATAAQLQGLKDLLSEQRSAEHLNTALKAARTFHLELASVTCSYRVRSILEDLVDEVRRLHYLLPNVEGHITSEEEIRAHDTILKAVEAGDGDEAARLTLEHLNEVAHTLVKGFAGV